MPQQPIRSFLFLFVVAFAYASVAVAQSPTAPEAPTVPAENNWQVAQTAAASEHKLLVITLDQPKRRQTCRVRSFSTDKLVCSHIGGSRTYLPQQVLALIVPGDAALGVRLLLGFNAGLAASIYATVVLVAICPACAAATAFAAFFCFGAAGAVLIGGNQPDRLLYLADGQHLTGKLRFLQPYAETTKL